MPTRQIKQKKLKLTTLKCSNITDIGVNLTSDRFTKDLADTLQRGLDAGVHRHIITGTSVHTSQHALELSLDDTLPCERYATAGFHPHNASENNPESWQQLAQLWQHPKVVAIGETGLDFNRNFSTPKQQLHSFEQHLQAAVDLQLPLFLHERDAADEFLQLISQYRSGFSKAVVHCFTGTEAFLKQLLDLDIHIGITGWICDERRGEHLQGAVKWIPNNLKGGSQKFHLVKVHSDAVVRCIDAYENILRNPTFRRRPPHLDGVKHQRFLKNYRQRYSQPKNAETHAYSYAYNDGHSDSRKGDDYRPNLSGSRQEADFKKILKQKAEYSRDSDGRFSSKSAISLTTAAIIGLAGAYLWRGKK